MHGLPAGEVAHAFHRWGRTIRRPRQDLTPYYGYDDSDLRSGYYHVRTLLELALHALRTKARRELRAALAPLDDQMLRRTANNPFAPSDLPWWKRRIEL
ncbi:hypothetical protein AB0O05_40350 [Streptomyces sp. NPDC093084]|uniref:hypothetical protein n=1 Tax=Streptomyces sp. NPDC093084 TaxID=3155197 RepID=UPI00342579CF